MQEMTEIDDCLDSHPGFSVMLEHLMSAYKPRISDRPFSEIGIFKGLSYLVLESFSSHFFLCTFCQDWTAYLSSAVKAKVVLPQ